MDNLAGESTDENNIKGLRKKKTDKDYHKINKETYEMQLKLDSSGWLLQQPFGSQHVSTCNWGMVELLIIVLKFG